jgi:ATP-binding cassette, subfamily A (ABC1), member 3
MMAAFAVFLIKERVSKAKHLQFLSGASAINFWTSTFIWDLFHYVVCTILIFLVWTIFYQTNVLQDDLRVYLTWPRLGYTILLYVLYGFAHIPITYLLSYMFQIPASGFAWITIINIVTSNRQDFVVHSSQTHVNFASLCSCRSSHTSSHYDTFNSTARSARCCTYS